MTSIRRIVAWKAHSADPIDAIELHGDLQGDRGRSPIGSYWSNDKDGDIEIDVMAVDKQHQTLFAGECKYRHGPVDLPVYNALKRKVDMALEIKRCYPGYKVLYGLFSKSGFTERMKGSARKETDILLIQGTDILL